MSVCGRCGTDHVIHCTDEASLRQQVRDRDELLEAAQDDLTLQRARHDLDVMKLQVQLAAAVEALERATRNYDEDNDACRLARDVLAKIRGGAK